jgi:23S rRNA pseudouridine2457 synthase
MLLAFHKPYAVLSQFTSDGSPNCPLSEFNFPKGVYPIGRLDADSEGLLLLSDEPGLNDRLLHPRHAHEREYWVQVERIPTPEALRSLAKGVTIEGRKTLPCRARLLDPQPKFPPRDPPIRVRKTVPTCWISVELVEGKNRQVRKMTAAIGHPTLRLLRVRIGNFHLSNLAPGTWKELSTAERAAVLGSFSIRLARPDDLPALADLIPLSVRVLQAPFYSTAQIEASLSSVFDLDRLLIADGTYFVVEHSGQVIGCGGWSHRQAVCGGDSGRVGQDAALDPAKDPARIRAFFVHPDWARRGIGRALIEKCETAIRAAGFKTAVLVATLTGEHLYASAGYTAVERYDLPIPKNLTLPFVCMTKSLKKS